MNSQQLKQPTLTTRQANARRWQWLGLGLIGIVAALAIYFYAASVRDPQAQFTQLPVTMPAAQDPAVQGMNGYLRAHANVDRAMAVDPAVQGVMDYLRVHSAMQPAVPARFADPAQQGVAGYLRAHRAAELTLFDPAQQGVLDYLRAHGADQPSRASLVVQDPAQQGVMDYLRAHGQ